MRNEILRVTLARERLIYGGALLIKNMAGYSYMFSQVCVLNKKIKRLPIFKPCKLLFGLALVLILGGIGPLASDRFTI